MFCGWGHRKGCVCDVCRSLGARSTRFPRGRKTILNLSPAAWRDEEVLQRPKPGERPGPQEAAFDDADFTKSYPTLAAYLTQTKYVTGEHRVTSTILIFIENGVLRLCLNDRDNNRSVFFTGETVEACLISAENAILAGTADWRTKSSYRNGDQKTPF